MVSPPAYLSATSRLCAVEPRRPPEGHLVLAKPWLSRVGPCAMSEPLERRQPAEYRQHQLAERRTCIGHVRDALELRAGLVQLVDRVQEVPRASRRGRAS